MSRGKPFSTILSRADSIIAAVVGFCIILLFCRHGGIGVSPDSVIYMSVAENIHEQGTAMDFNQLMLVDFPLFYPSFLSSLSFLTGLKPIVYGPVLNATLFALVIYCSGQIMKNFSFPSAWYRWALLACLAVSPALLEIYSMLWSETLFILLVLLFIIIIYYYLQSNAIKHLLLAGLIVAIALVTRYAGITLLAAGGLLLLMNRSLTWRKRIAHLLLFGITGCSLLFINLIRNKTVSHTLTGYREPANSTFAKNLHDAGSVFCDWLPFLSSRHLFASVVIVCIMTALGFVWIKKTLHNNKPISGEYIALTFFLVYGLFIIIIATISRFQPLDNRLLSPLYIPFLWSISSWLPVTISKNEPAGRKWFIAGSVLFFTCFQYNQLAAVKEMWEGIKDAGIPGYTEDQWRYSPTVAFIQKNKSLFKEGYTIYSNASDAVYFFTGMKSELLPHKDFPADIAEFMKDDTCYVVWFNDGYNPDLVGMDFITGTKKMKLVKQFEDGAVYAVDF